jgi:hypothetical protein
VAIPGWRINLVRDSRQQPDVGDRTFALDVANGRLHVDTGEAIQEASCGTPKIAAKGPCVYRQFHSLLIGR